VPQVVVRSRKVYYELHGEQPGIPLILIMGTGGSCRGWLPIQVPDFSREHRTLIFDHPGVGGSDEWGSPFTTADLADGTIGLMDALEIERANVLGAFMGGMIAQEMALRNPDRIHRLILSGTYARPDAKRRMLIQHWRELSLGGASVEVMVRERMLWTLQDETLEQTDLIDQMIDFFVQDGAPLTEEVFARQCDACLAHDTADRLRDIPHVTLVVCGRRDLLTPPHFHRELADEIPNAHLVTLPYGGHFVMAEAAEQFNHIVLQFLADDLD
jgi:pimeloyl-ACP methyl ester carboxylesterase